MFELPEDAIEIKIYKPEGVKKFLTLGGECFIGIVDQNTVLKYAQNPDDKITKESFDREARIYQIIGPHPRIIGYKGRQGDGILMEFATNGPLGEYLTEHNPPTIQQRLHWVHQLCEAVTYIHYQGIIHCDIKANNCLLDGSLNVKLCDFQSRILSTDADDKRAKDFIVHENAKSYMPRTDQNHSDQITDIFALGSTIYHIMEGHLPFPDLEDFDDENITKRFRRGEFPELTFSPMTPIVHSCWGGKYKAASEVLGDVELVKGDFVCLTGKVG